MYSNETLWYTDGTGGQSATLATEIRQDRRIFRRNAYGQGQVSGRLETDRITGKRTDWMEVPAMRQAMPAS